MRRARRSIDAAGSGVKHDSIAIRACVVPPENVESVYTLHISRFGRFRNYPQLQAFATPA